MQQKFRFFGAAALLFLSCCFFSFVVAGRLAEGIWKQLGITRQDGADKIKKSFLDGWFHYEGLKKARAIAVGDRAAATTELLSYTKQYIGTPYFKSAYDKMRSESKPSEPKDYTRSKEQIRQEKVADAKKLVENSEAAIKTTPANMKKTMESILDMNRKNLAACQDPASKEIEALYQEQLTRRKQELDDYKKYSKQWEIDYPADYRLFVKARIRKYLELAATVDFSATVHEKNGKQVFDKTGYQYKSNDWKMIYRAGREVYDVTRPFAEKWMQELAITI
jgi:hypothetical protein